jgi:hypothetical protein
VTSTTRTATQVTPGNTGDADAAGDLLAADLPTKTDPADRTPADDTAADDTADDTAADAVADAAEELEQPLAVYGDAAYGSGALLGELEAAGAEIMCKVQPANAPGGRFTKGAFDIDLAAGTVTCPGKHTTGIRPAKAMVVPPSGRAAPVARWLPSALVHPPDAPSASGFTRPSCPGHEPSRRIRLGGQSTGRLGRRSNASEGT